MERKSYSIRLENLAKAQERAAAMQRKAEKMGIPFPTITFGEPYEHNYRNIDNQEVSVWLVDVALEGEGIDKPVSFGGWKIIGRFNHEYPTGVIFNRLSDDVNPKFIERFEKENISYCEECGKKLHRLNTYAIQNEESGDQMLVGSSCMHKFVPIQKSVDEIINFYCHLPEDMGLGEGDDWYARDAAPSKYDSTYSYLRGAFMVLLAGKSHRDPLFPFYVTESRKYARGVPAMARGGHLDEVKKIIKHFDDAESEMHHLQLFIQALPDNEFNTKLKRIAGCEYHLITDQNVLAWGAIKYYDYLHTRKPKKVGHENNNLWIGQPGEVLEQNVHYEGGKYLYSGTYDEIWLYTFKTKEGNTITWKTGYRDMSEVESNFIMRGRIKEHTEFHGVRQTQVTRPSFRAI